MYGAFNSQRTSMEWTRTGENHIPHRVTTTLYHLIATLQDCIPAENDELLVAAIQRLLGAGRIKLLRERCDRRRDVDSPA